MKPKWRTPKTKLKSVWTYIYFKRWILGIPWGFWLCKTLGYLFGWKGIFVSSVPFFKCMTQILRFPLRFGIKWIRIIQTYQEIICFLNSYSADLLLFVWPLGGAVSTWPPANIGLTDASRCEHEHLDEQRHLDKCHLMILTKLFGPSFLQAVICFEPKFLMTQNFLDPKF